MPCPIDRICLQSTRGQVVWVGLRTHNYQPALTVVNRSCKCLPVRAGAQADVTPSPAHHFDALPLPERSRQAVQLSLLPQAVFGARSASEGCVQRANKGASSDDALTPEAIHRETVRRPSHSREPFPSSLGFAANPRRGQQRCRACQMLDSSAELATPTRSQLNPQNCEISKNRAAGTIW